MKINVISKIKKCDCLVVPVFEDEKLKSVETLIGKLKVFDFTGEKMDLHMEYDEMSDISRVLLVGMGKREKLSAEIWKRVVGTAIKYVQSKKLQNVAVQVPAEVALAFGAGDAGRLAAIGAEIAHYSFDRFKSDKNERAVCLKNVDFVVDNVEFANGVKKGVKIAAGVNFARDLGNMPPNEMNPAVLADEAEKMAEKFGNLGVKVLSEKDLEKLGAGCLLAVARGSVNAPKMIVMEYSGAKKSEKPTVLVGKGVTYDAGGMSLKSGKGQLGMKYDMMGGATVLGVMRAIAGMKIVKNVVAIVPAVENMPSGGAYRVDDIVMAMNGKTVEICNTDAEGRLILADALVYAQKFKPAEIIDVATLTGAVVAALGSKMIGFFTESNEMNEKINKSAEKCGEKVWRLPLGEEYAHAMEGKAADLKNTGKVGDGGGASTAAAFLENFVEKGAKWMHVDIAAVCDDVHEEKWVKNGTKGTIVETFVDYLS